jgi:hypothetical protein
MNKCKKCNNNCEGEYCFQHKPRTQLQRGKKPSLTSRKKVSDGKSHQMSVISNKKVKNVQNNKHIMQREMFLEICKKRKHHSEVSGAYLGKEPMSTYFHHILPKEKYPDACLDEENIILLTLDEHTQVEMDIYRYEEINNRRKYLMNKYG